MGKQRERERLVRNYLHQILTKRQRLQRYSVETHSLVGGQQKMYLVSSPFISLLRKPEVTVHASQGAGFSQTVVGLSGTGASLVPPL